MTTQPLHWLKQIEEELQLSKRIPLWGAPPSFPWALFSQELASYLHVENVKISLEKQGFLSKEELLTSFGKNPSIRTLELTPLKGYLSLVFSMESLAQITSDLLLPNPDTDPKGLGDINLQEGFYQYLLLRTTECLEKLQVYQGLHIQWLDKTLIPETSSFACDISISFQEKVFPARIVFSQEFQYSFSHHFEKTAPSPFSSPLINTVDLHFHLQAGSCLLSQEEWKSLRVGDFLILDTCSYNPELKKGTLQLTLEGTSLFKVKIKKNTLKILDYCAYNGEANMMDDEMDLESFDEEPPLELEPEEEMEKLEEAPEEKPDLLNSLSSPLEIPFPIVVEVDRIKMSLGKLLELVPGNILDLSVHPEQGVYLTVHGKKIARGELVKIGEALGVKIVELGEAPKL